ncbi:uncharacterized protein LOC109717653 [Ananas comosus]|uniref:Uncharacterized protein LOC109717653 n=1 Tax=Ananas comosus TaxID=4615 RepID=A0A6P5FT66_ANACO|nr:uncharacterized protein LOC109717653 [Ananas comosus]
MDSLQLSNDSFSYSWLINPKPSFVDPSGLDDSPRLSLDAVGAFADDPKVAVCRTESQSFHFCPPVADPAAMAHADQMFNNGRLLPLHLMTATASVQFSAALGMLSSSSSSKSSASSLSSSLSSGGGEKLAVQLFGECARSSKRFIYKYLSFLLKGLGMMGRSRRRRRRKRRSGVVGSSRSCTEGAAGSTARDAVASFDWLVGDRASDDLGRENAIEDAILHCKNSIINGEGVKEM